MTLPFHFQADGMGLAAAPLIQGHVWTRSTCALPNLPVERTA